MPFRFLLVKGTKVRLQGPLREDLGQTRMRWALALNLFRAPLEAINQEGNSYNLELTASQNWVVLALPP